MATPVARGLIHAVLLLLAACGGGSAARVEAPRGVPDLAGVRPYFVPGETITWKLSLAGIEGGQGRLAVGAIGLDRGARVVVVSAEAQTSGVVTLLKRVTDVATSWIDTRSGLPLRNESESRDGGRHWVIHTLRRPGSRVADMTVWRQGVESQREQLLPPETHDWVSAVMLLRAWDGPKGTSGVLYTLGGAKIWRNVLTIDGHEELDTDLGRRKTVRITGVSTRLTQSLDEDRERPQRTFTLWMTTDEERIPILVSARTELGDVKARATSYNRP